MDKKSPYNYIELPVDIVKKADELGICLVNKQSKNYLNIKPPVETDGQWQVWYCGGAKKADRRYIIAHGIALAMQQRSGICRDDVLDLRHIRSVSLDTNNLAMDLLIPPEYLLYLYNELDIVNRDELAKVFDVSNMVMHFQLIHHDLKIRV